MKLEIIIIFDSDCTWKYNFIISSPSICTPVLYFSVYFTLLFILEFEITYDSLKAQQTDDKLSHILNGVSVTATLNIEAGEKYACNYIGMEWWRE